MKKEEKINKLNLLSKNRSWILIIFYVIFIYVSLPFFPAFITTLRGFISKELLNLISLALTILFFLILSVWIYNKKYNSKGHISSRGRTRIKLFSFIIKYPSKACYINDKNWRRDRKVKLYA